MRLTTVILIASLLQVSAATYAQRITINKQNANLAAVLKEIRTQSGFDILYDGKTILLNQKVDISVANATLDEALNSVFKGLKLKYNIDGKIITISKEEDSSFLSNMIAKFQSIDVRGKIVDAETVTPLPGATVTVKGSKRATKTGADGTFFLENVDEKSVLVITYTGYATKEIPASKELGVIRIEVSVKGLEEVGVTVNTGYQRILPQQVTGAISQIKTKDFESRISTDFLAGLQNRLPGLLINNDVQFQGNNLFQIRGIATITGNPTPLIVLDGYPTDLSLNDINPNEIESVTILKDAAAAAIYGVRASNGVIIIDRKKGMAGDAHFAFRSTISIKPKEDYSRYKYDKDGSIGLNYFRNLSQGGLDFYIPYETAGFAPILSSLGGPDAAVNLLIDKWKGSITQQQMEAGFAQLATYDNTADYEKYFLRNAVTQQYNLNISGGTPKALYYLTGNYLGNRLTQKNNDSHKVQFSGRSNLELSKKLSLELLTDYNETIGDKAPIPNFDDIYPSERFADDNGNPLPVKAGSAAVGSQYTVATMPKGFLDQRMFPLTEMNEVNTRQRVADYRVTANLRYNIDKGLDFSLGGIYESSQTQQRQYASENSSMTRKIINAYTQPISGTTPAVYNIPKGGYLQEQQSLLRSYTTRAQLNYNKQISSSHSINAILGAELRKTVTQGSNSATFGYNDQTLLQQPTDYSKLFNTVTSFNTNFNNTQLAYADLFGQNYNDDRFVSGYMNAVYAYKSRYSVTGSIRIDQSNLFGSDPKYRYKPLWSLGAAWNIDREGFMAQVSWVNALKLRIARGFNGNISKASLPQVIAQYTLNDVLPAVVPALSLSSPANSGLRWEQTDIFNVGLDFTLFKNVSGSMDYYSKRSTDVLGKIAIAPTKGISPAMVNQASINNHGLEFNLNADWVRRRNLNWNTGLVVSYNRSKVLETYIPQSSSTVAGGAVSTLTSQRVIAAAAGGYMKGEPVGIIYSYRYAGIDAEGNALYYNSKGEKTSLNTAEDEGYGSLDSRGTSIPATNLGLSNRLDIGNFYFFCMINYYGGFAVRAPLPTPGPAIARPIEGAGDYWKQAGDESKVSLPSSRYMIGLGQNYLANSDRYILNGAYLTIGDVTASYNLKHVPFLKKAGFSNFEIKAQASNIYTVGFNRENYSLATGNYLKRYITPTYTIGFFTNF